MSGRATDLARRPEDGLFAAETTAGRVMLRTMLLATGVTDRHLDITDPYDAIQRGGVRYCAICDGYESAGRRLGVRGSGNSGRGEALFLRTWCSDVTLLSM